MAYKHTSPDNRRKSKFLLKKLVAVLEQEPDDAEAMEPSSALGEAVGPWIRLSNVAGVHVYQDKAGWYADLILDETPPGVPKVIGTPMAMPKLTREEAEEEAVALLRMAAANEKAVPKPEPGGDAIFEWDQIAIPVPSDLVAKLMEQGDPPEDYIRQRLGEVRRELTGGGPLTPEIARTFGHDQKLKVLTMAAMALCAGIHRWPPARRASEEPSMKQ